MSDLQGLLQSLPIDEIANQLGEDPAAVQQAAAEAVPALLGGLEQNAQNPSGAASLAQALGDHDSNLLDGGVSLADVDTADGAKIAQHILGNEAPSEISALSASGGAGESLVKKLLPILAPIVMAWLFKQVQQKSGSQPADGGQGGAGGGIVGSILGKVLGGGQQGQSSSSGNPVQSILLDVLGQALQASADASEGAAPSS